MAQNANEILSDILNVCKKINSNLDKSSSPHAPGGAHSAGVNGPGMSGFKGLEGFDTSDAKLKNLQNSAKAMKDLGNGMSELTKSMTKFWMTPKGAKTSVIHFMRDVLEHTAGKTGSARSVAIAAQSMGIVGYSIEALSKNLMKFWMIPKGAKNAVIDFMKDLLDQFKGTTPAQGNSAIKAANAMGVIGQAMTNLNKNLIKFWMMPKAAKMSIINFMKDLLELTKGKKAGGGDFKTIAESMQIIGTAMTSLGKTKLDAKKVDFTAKALDRMFDVIIGIGKKKTAINNSIKLFDSLSKSLDGMTKFINSFSKFLLSIGVSILMIAGALWVAGKLLGVNGAGMVLGVIAAVIVGMAGLMFLLSKASGHVEPGIKTAQGMGKAMVFLSLGILSFALTLRVLPTILGIGKTGFGAIGLSLLTLVGIVAAMAGIFWLLGKMQSAVVKGTAAAAGIALGMAVLSLGIMSIALTSRLLTSMGDKTDKDGNKKYDQKTGFGRMMAAIGPGLGLFGIILVSGVAAIIGMGALIIPIGIGIAATLLVSGGLMLMSLAVVNVVNASKKIGNADVKGTISNMVGGVLGGLVEGVSNGMMGENRSKGGIKNGIANLGNFLKNGAMLTASIGLLMGVSVMLSMFAYALTAFANLQNMRVIESYDPVTGKPKFGPTVNVENVGKTITTTIGEFLTGLIASTDKLTFKESRNIDRMAKALTGKNGMLSAVIQFAEVIKTFSQFGPKGEIGFVDMVPDGVDPATGVAKWKQVPTKVKITDVVNSITSSFSQFATAMSSHAEDFGVTGKEGRKMLNFSQALMGSDALKVFGLSFGKKKPGLLEPIKAFSEILTMYAKYGEKSEIPTYDENGVFVKSIPVDTIAENVVKMLSSFTTALGKQNVSKDISKAEDNLETFVDIIDQVNKIGTAMDPLANLTSNIGLLADNMMRLATALTGLNTVKLGEVSSIANKAMAVNSTGVKNVSVTPTGQPFGSNVSNKPVQQQAAPVQTSSVPTETTKQQKTITPTPIKPPEPINWDMIGKTMGEQVAASLKNGTFNFVFNKDNTGIIMHSKS